MDQSALIERLERISEQNPALVEHARKRAESIQNQIADRITKFAGSMHFVYLHVVWFAAWIALGVEAYPYGLLTMIVSLEAIFLSTFVMISQNRTDAKRQAAADLQWANRERGGQAKPAAARVVEPDPRPDEGDPQLDRRTIPRRVAAWRAPRRTLIGDGHVLPLRRRGS
jgi:uncharacterized membrane protein